MVGSWQQRNDPSNWQTTAAVVDTVVANCYFYNAF